MALKIKALYICKMENVLFVVGKTDDQQLISLIERYQQRIVRYGKFRIEIIPDLKNRKTQTVEQQKIQEGKRILNKVTSADYIVLMDEKGKQMDSPTFASWIAKKQHLGAKRCLFVIGGPYGFSDDLYQRADEKIALSKMTFSHQMVRLFFVEQLYRAYAILNNEPYHHQ
ncbi:MAG: 23S rRNA (pseudouridine(1915)-N(3))-methyltransferase RlmH [Flavobacteriaceae bacterium]